MNPPDSGVKKLFKPDDVGQLLLGWLIHAHKGRQRHDYAARSCDRIRLWVGGPAVVFSAIVGTSVFAALEKDGASAAPASNLFKAAIALVSITAAILTGLSTFLNLAEKAEKHRSAGVRYKEVIRELERILSEGAKALAEGESALSERVQKRLDELEETAPIVPERIYDRVEKEWHAGGIRFTASAADLYRPEDAAPYSGKSATAKSV